MDQVFAHCVDVISLSGSSGTTLLGAVETVLGRNPGPNSLAWLARQFIARKHHLFSSPNFSAPPDKLRIISCEILRRRALGYSPIEHPQLPTQAWIILERIGTAGPSGTLQSELAAILNISPAMINHYVTTLCARSLVAKMKVVRTTHRLPESVSAIANPSPGNESREENQTLVTYTAVLVLARFAAILSASTNQTKNNQNERKLWDGDADKEIAVLNVAMNSRVKRILEALRDPPHVRAEKDLKTIAFQDWQQACENDVSTPYKASESYLVRRRHRGYRAMRSKLLNLGYVTVIERECLSTEGRVLGKHSCLELTPKGKAQVFAADDLSKTQKQSMQGNSTNQLNQANGISENQSENDRKPQMLVEVDISQQIYQLLENSKADGISVPDIRNFFNGTLQTVGIGTKRIRNVITEISKREKIAERQKFDGSAMSLMFFFSRHDKSVSASKDINGDPSDLPQIDKPSTETSQGLDIPTPERPKSRKSGITSLGEKRKDMLLKWLLERKVMVIETLGREIANSEGSGLVRVDRKVMIRIIDSLIVDGSAKVIKTVKPATTASQKTQEVKLIALPNISISSPEVRNALLRTTARHISVQKNDHTKRTNVISKPDKKLQPKTTKVSAEVSNNMNTPCEGKNDVITADTQEKKRPMKKQKISVKESSNCDKISKVDECKAVSQNKNDKPNQNRGGDKEDAQKDNDKVYLEQKRDYTISRIWRLRTIDYGWIKGKLARVRRFHKCLYRILSKEPCVGSEGTSDGYHSTIEAAMQASPLGTFSVYSCLRSMTVGEYASTVGLHIEYGQSINKIQAKKIVDVMDILHGEITSTYASRQTSALIQFLIKLGLVSQGENAEWVLSGSGIIQDFGKGLPIGVMPHGIIFPNEKAIDRYWKELQEFSYARIVNAQTNSPSSPDNINHPERKFVTPVNEIYLSSRWKKGSHCDFLNVEQLIFEAVLQRMCNVELKLFESGAISIENFIQTPLRHFPVQELHDEIVELFEKAGQCPVKGRLIEVVEHLMFYSRFRSDNIMPDSIKAHTGAVVSNMAYLIDPKMTSTKPSEQPSPQKEKPSPQKQKPTEEQVVMETKKKITKLPKVRNFARDSRPFILKITRDLMEDNSINPIIDRSSVAIGEKPKDSIGKDLRTSSKTLQLAEFAKYLRFVIQSRALGYFLNDNGSLEWKTIFTSLRKLCVEKEKFTCDDDKGNSRNLMYESLVTALNSALMRSGVDILSMQLALELGDKHGVKTQRSRIGHQKGLELLKESADYLNQGCLDPILMALVMEIKVDLEVQVHIKISCENDVKFLDESFRKRLMNATFQLSGTRRVRGFSIGHMLTALASRYRRVLDLRSRSKVRYGIMFLLKENRYESHKNDRMKRMGARQSPINVDELLERSGTLNTDSTLLQKDNSEGQMDSTDDVALTCVNNEKSTIASKVQHGSAQKHRRELLELVLLGIIQLPNSQQQTIENLKKLKIYNENDLSVARNELILRGSIFLAEEGGHPYFTLASTRVEKSSDILNFLENDEASRRTQKWNKTLDNWGISNNGEPLSLEETSFWPNMRNGNKMNGCAHSLYTLIQKSIFPKQKGNDKNDDLRLIPMWIEEEDSNTVEDEEEDERELSRIMLCVQKYKENGNTKLRNRLISQEDESIKNMRITGKRGRTEENLNRSEQAKKLKKDNGELELETDIISEEVQKVSEYFDKIVSECGCSGLTLLEMMKDEYIKTKPVMVINMSLNNIMKNTQRFGVETRSNDEDWMIGEGALYVKLRNGEKVEEMKMKIIQLVRKCIIKISGRSGGINMKKLACDVRSMVPNVTRQMVVDEVMYLVKNKIIVLRRTSSKELFKVREIGMNTNIDIVGIWGSKGDSIFVEMIAGMENELCIRGL